MKRSIPELKRIDCRSNVLTEAFFYQLQCALLLALQEKGMLTATQYSAAAQKLQIQYPQFGTIL